MIVDVGGGVRLACRMSGPVDAPVLVLLHGGGTDGSAWDELAPALAGTWRVCVPDLRGHGASDRPGEYSLAGMAEDLRGLLRGLGIARAVVVGHSMGGVVAYLFAAAYPALVSALALAETPPPVPLGLPVPARPAGGLRYDWDARLAVLAELNQPAPSWTEALSRITAPALVVAGGPSSHLPQDEQAAMAALVRGARLVTLPAGHRVHQDPGFGALVHEFASTTLRYHPGLPYEPLRG
ncbi:alpha/beta fold hydrolase [Longispora albida]|uniref:alpha/beta fold hydrolase n=1 Tax=Longispora albida TaxID=203523 RepID=UPI0003756B6F|nr:alpha/beta hydrolase [Longispora albida]